MTDCLELKERKEKNVEGDKLKEDETEQERIVKRKKLRKNVGNNIKQEEDKQQEDGNGLGIYSRQR